MDLVVVLLIVGFVALAVAALVINRRSAAARARRRIQLHGDQSARHVGEYQSQRGRVYPVGKTNHQANPDS